MILIGIIIKINIDKKGVEEITEEPEESLSSQIVVDNIVRPVKVRNEYFVVETCVTKFYSFYSEINTEDKTSVQPLYNMLDEKYISFSGITEDNIIKKLKKIEPVSINLDDMYVCQKDVNVSTYFVYGRLRNQTDNKISKFSMVVNVDFLHSTFSVCLEDYIDEKYKDLKEGDTIQLYVADSIENKQYNIFDYQHISDTDYIRRLFSDYRDNVIYDKEVAYESLDKQYRTARFENLEDYMQYAKKSIRQLIMAELDPYKVTKYDDYTQYMVQDTKGNYYIFRETATMKYGLVLDIYSIDIPEFIKKYESTNVEGRVVLNIKKFIDALNYKDVNYIYNNLAQGFKNNKFKTEAHLKKYIEANLNGVYSVQYDSFKNEGNVYIYEISLKDTSNTNKTIKMQVIMQLLENLKYEMSFSIVSK